MSDFRKPRADTPIVPQSALFRKVKKAPKKPKGRRGKKPKGKRVGNFVSRQDPNFILRKEEDELRRAREQSQRQTQQQEVLIQAQIEDIRDRRVEGRAQLLVANQRLLLDAGQAQANLINQREALRLQGEANQQERQRGNAELAQRAAANAQRATAGQRQQQDNFQIYGELRRLYRQNERRDGENERVMREFLREGQQHQGRRGQGRQSLDLSIGAERERETTDLDFAPRATSDQRRQRRQKVSPREREVIDALSAGETSIEEVLPRARSLTPRPEPQPEPQPEPESFRPRILRGDPDPPQPFGDFTPDKEVGKYLSGQRKQPVSTIARTPPPAPPRVARPITQSGRPRAIAVPQTNQGSAGINLFQSPAGRAFAEEFNLSVAALEPTLTDDTVARDLRAMADRIKFSP
tara:strand:- start:117 stop:1343 length:1227 start_codon:yes stop_codon:yes gene_type:complete